MRKLSLRNSPAQRFRVRVGRNELRTQWMFNTVSGYWSLTVWMNDEVCPRMAGKKVLPNVDLLAGYDFSEINQELWVVRRPRDRSTNWYDRLRFNPAGAIIVLLSPEEREQIVIQETAEQQQC